MACLAVGVTLRSVRVALPCDIKAERTKERAGMKQMPRVSNADLFALASNPNRPTAVYIGSDEPLAKYGADRSPFQARGAGVGLDGLAQFLLDNHPKIIEHEAKRAVPAAPGIR